MSIERLLYRIRHARQRVDGSVRGSCLHRLLIRGLLIRGLCVLLRSRGSVERPERFGRRYLAAEWFAVFKLLGAVETTTDTALTVRIIREERYIDAGVTAAVYLRRSDNRVAVDINNLRLLLARCGEHPAALALIAEAFAVRADSVAVVNRYSYHRWHCAVPFACYTGLLGDRNGRIDALLGCDV
jgi:hypothetical protein